MPDADADEPDLEQLALARHRLPEWAAFAELRAGTGYGDGKEQRFDVAAFNCWPSKGDYRVAYEIKRYRGDFLRELDQPAKRSQAEEYFHETWFVCLRDVCAAEEVPDGWGLLVPTKKGDKLRQLKRARPRTPADVPYSMLMSALRKSAQRAELAERQPVFSLDGRDVSPEDIERIVRERVQVALLHEKTLERDRVRKVQYATQRLRFAERARILRGQLADMAYEIEQASQPPESSGGSGV